VIGLASARPWVRSPAPKKKKKKKLWLGGCLKSSDPLCVYIFLNRILCSNDSFIYFYTNTSHCLEYSSFIRIFFGGSRVWTQKLHACKADFPLLEPHFQSILFWLFWRWGRSLELFAQADLEQWSSWSQLPK
jgi:hypothetical protein